MDYEKKYKEALEHARVEILADPGLQKMWEEIFPELAESEDERIRKEIKHHISLLEYYRFMDASKEECLAYLEKQKEQKPEEHVPENGETGTRKEQEPVEWSEGDERTIADLINYFEGDSLECSIEEMVQRIKSLRPQSKAEPTLLDKNIIEAAVAFVEQNDHFNCWGGIDKHTVIKALRSIKPQLLSNPSLYEVCEHLREESVDRLKTLHTKVNVNSEKVSANSEKVNVNWSEEDERRLCNLMARCIALGKQKGWMNDDDEVACLDIISRKDRTLSESDKEMIKIIISELEQEGKDVNVPRMYEFEINWLKSFFGLC